MSVMVTLVSAPVLVNVRAEMNDHEAMTVKLYETNGTCHLVAYESERIRDVLASPFKGARVLVEMVHAGSRSNIWKAAALHSRQILPADQSARMAS